MEQNTKTPIVVGIVGHISAEKLTDFKNHVQNFYGFRLIIFKESNNKLWLIERGDDY